MLSKSISFSPIISKKNQCVLIGNFEDALLKFMLCTIILLFSLQLFGIHEWDKEYVHDYRIGFVGHQPQY